MPSLVYKYKHNCPTILRTWSFSSNLSFLVCYCIILKLRTWCTWCFGCYTWCTLCLWHWDDVFVIFCISGPYNWYFHCQEPIDFVYASSESALKGKSTLAFSMLKSTPAWKSTLVLIRTNMSYMGDFLPRMSCTYTYRAETSPITITHKRNYLSLVIWNSLSLK